MEYFSLVLEVYLNCVQPNCNHEYYHNQEYLEIKDKKNAPLIGFGSKVFCLLSGDPNNHPRRSRSFFGIGSTSVIAAKNDYIEYREQGKSSRGSLRPSSNKSMRHN